MTERILEAPIVVELEDFDSFPLSKLVLVVDLLVLGLLPRGMALPLTGKSSTLIIIFLLELDMLLLLDPVRLLTLKKYFVLQGDLYRVLFSEFFRIFQFFPNFSIFSEFFNFFRIFQFFQKFSIFSEFFNFLKLFQFYSNTGLQLQGVVCNTGYYTRDFASKNGSKSDKPYNDFL